MAEYRVESGKVRHRGEYYRPGETFEADLSDRQVAAMELSVVDDEGGTASDDAAPDADDEGEDDGDAEAPEELTAEFVENAEYAELRTAAGRFDDINGNWGEARLRTELLDKVESEG